MNIRNGTYTRIEGCDYLVNEFRDDSPDEINYVLLIDHSTEATLEGFSKSEYGYFWKKIAIDDLSNAFEVRTVGIYKNINVRIFSKSNVSTTVVVCSPDKNDANRAGLIEVNPNWFSQDVSISEISNIHEIYFASNYAVPVPTKIVISEN